jgi:RNA polymerase sigma factor (TIGR02999 family)
MDARPDGDVTRILARVRDGEEGAGDQLFALLYAELHGLADRLFRSQRPQHTLQPTALVHEAWLKMLRPAGEAAPWRDRVHFFAVAARAMRQILVNHARDRSAQKRGGGRDARRVTLAGVASPASGRELEILAVEEALAKLAELDERQARIAELKLFSGLTNREVAEAVERPLRTVELDWKMAKSWLAGRLGGPSL